MPLVPKTTEIHQAIGRNMLSQGKFLIAQFPPNNDRPVIIWDDLTPGQLRTIRDCIDYQMEYHHKEPPKQYREEVRR